MLSILTVDKYNVLHTMAAIFMCVHNVNKPVFSI